MRLIYMLRRVSIDDPRNVKLYYTQAE